MYEKLFSDLQYLYKAFLIPLYLYDGNSLLISFPERDMETNSLLPPQNYLEALQTSPKTADYISTSFSAYYGLLRLHSTPNLYLIIGPASSIPYSKEILHQLQPEFKGFYQNRDFLTHFLHTIPICDHSRLVEIIHILNHFLNPDHALELTNSFDATALKKHHNQLYMAHTNQLMHQKETGLYNNSIQSEHTLEKIVETGDLALLLSIQDSLFTHVNPGLLSKNALRNNKNLFISYITLITRAAIRGGMDEASALALSDEYIQQAENFHVMTQVDALYKDSLLAFTQQVSNIKYAVNVHSDIFKIITYVRTHTNSHLTVSSIAHQYGYNSNYLSSKFKKELGFGLSSFILRTKLEESKQMLQYTNKSILDISTYLCFSSQNHFQTAFRKTFGLTPNAFRNQNR